MWGGLDWIAGTDLLVDCRTPEQWRAEHFQPTAPVGFLGTGVPEGRPGFILRATGLIEFRECSCTLCFSLVQLSYDKLHVLNRYEGLR